ncbi:GntR family transcriptional regulator, partial [Bordetella pertussis]|uniref:GntR family transcriptional regulator n=1 Tax=Bordetella pertussis TaxID=520 RepID=UPI0012B3D8EB
MRQADATLVTQLADDLARRIDEHGLRPGTRLPSIRRMAEQSGVSRFTVVEAYDRLVARGLVQSRHGAGFFVRARSASLTALASARVPQAAPETPVRVDVSWLLRNMFRETAAGMPGGDG